MPTLACGKRKIYSAFGFLLASDIEIPGLNPAEETADASNADVRVLFGQVPESISDPLDRTDWFEYSRNEAILRADNELRYYVRDGNLILIQAAENVSADKITAFLLDFPFGVLLIQRSFLALHGSSVTMNGRTVAFLGRSGEGKSALVHEMMIRGGTVITDDICAIQLRNGVPMIYPGIYRLSVWRDTISSDLDNDSRYRPVREGIEKYYLDISESATCEPIRLDEVWFISEGNGERILFEKLKGCDKFKRLMQSFAHRVMAEKVLGKDVMFQMCTQTLRHVSVGAIRKNSDLMSVSEYANSVIAELFR